MTNSDPQRTLAARFCTTVPLKEPLFYRPTKKMSLSVLSMEKLCCRPPVLGLGLGVDFTFARDNKNNKSNPHLNFSKETRELGDKDQGIRDKGYGISGKGEGIGEK